MIADDIDSLLSPSSDQNQMSPCNTSALSERS